MDHHNPALTSEYFPLTVSVVNKESCNIRDLVISVAMDTTDKTSVDGQATGKKGRDIQAPLINVTLVLN